MNTNRIGISQHFSETLISLAAVTTAEEIDLATINQALGSRSVGSLLLFLSLPMVIPVPAPGISVAFGIPLIIISLQLLFGRQSLWLPASIAHRSISRENLHVYVTRALPALRRVEHLVQPRFAGMTSRVAIHAIGAMCLALALIITLPVPLGHLIPGAAISIMALGLIEQDGLAICAGLLTGLIALLVVFLAIFGLIAVQDAWFSS